MIVRFFALVLLVASSGIIQVLAQNLPVNDPRNEEFLQHFVQIRNLNPTVKDFNKMDVGYTYGLPNDQTDHLEIGDTNGIWGREFQKFYGISYEEFLRGRNPAPADPTTSGPAFIPGGIRPDETDRLRRHFDGFPNLVRISPVESGTITGEGEVRYSNGTIQRHTITTPIPAYQARYRRSDGTEEVVQTLQRCMNPLNNGGTVYRGFTFTPGSSVVPAPTSKEEDSGSPWLIPFLGAIIGMIIGVALGLAIPASTSKGNKGEKVSLVPKDEKPSGGKPSDSTSTPADPKPAMMIEKTLVPTTDIVPPKASVAPFSEQQTPTSSVEPEYRAEYLESQAAPLPAPHFEVEADKAKATNQPTTQFVSFTSPDKNGPSKLSWSAGVDLHTLHIDPNGVKTIRFSEKK